jgi:hypothetical protein
LLRKLPSRLALGFVSAITAFAVMTSIAVAATSVFGPQSWTDGTQSGRYRSNAGNHTIKVNSCSGISGNNIDWNLRIDVVGSSDISVGTTTLSCVGGATGGPISSQSSQPADFRGHFLQSKNFSGTATAQVQDTHP